MNKKQKTPMYIIRSLSMANHLVRCGHDILKVEPSEKDDKLMVFFFEDTPNLGFDMSKFRMRKRG